MTDLKALIAIGPQRSGFEFPSWIVRRPAKATPPSRAHAPAVRAPLSASDEAFLRDIGLA